MILPRLLWWSMVVLGADGAGAAPAASEPICCVPPPRIWLEQQVEAWQRERLERLTAPYGWLSLVGLHWLEGPGPWRIGRDQGEIALGRGPEQIGILRREETEEGAVFRLEGSEGEQRLAVDARGEPEDFLDLEGGVRLAVIRRGGRYALRVWDANAPLRLGFSGLEYFPASWDWVIEGRFVPYDPPRMLPVADVLGLETPRRNPGRVEFTVGDRRYTLEALQEQPGEDLFFVFADRTNGRETYGGGRFLYARPPDASGRVLLDFNRAYAPPCAFTPYSTCPLPPPENRLDLAVRAGEKLYRGGAGPVSGP
ncbi:MAG: hypothetical protein KatS3mg125_1902 [Lysobacterales bacterium]|nr:MAG: hypothetical protein KatS3mg125_1902 [Xanthomonadales bacterium]